MLTRILTDASGDNEFVFQITLFNIAVDREKLSYVGMKSVRQMVYKLCLVVLTEEQLVGRSVTEKTSNAHRGKAPKTKLDQDSIDAITGKFFSMLLIHPCIYISMFSSGGTSGKIF